MPSKEVLVKHSTILAAFLFIIWGFYRFLFKLPEEIEELFIKPAIWLIPVFYLLRKERLGLSSLGFTTKNLFSSVYLSLALGVVFALEGVVVNFVKYQGVDFSANIGNFWVALGLSFATAVSEEVVFRGYLFNRMWGVMGNEWKANVLTSVLWALIHVPISIFWWQLDLMGTLGYLVLTITFGMGSAFVFARTKNVTSSILLHVLWEWPILLFR